MKQSRSGTYEQALRIAEDIGKLDDFHGGINHGMKINEYLSLRWMLGAIEALLTDRQEDAVRYVSHVKIKEDDHTKDNSVRVECIRFLRDIIIYDTTSTKTLHIHKGSIYDPYAESFEYIKKMLDARFPDDEWHEFAVWGVWKQGV